MAVLFGNTVGGPDTPKYYNRSISDDAVSLMGHSLTFHDKEMCVVKIRGELFCVFHRCNSAVFPLIS